VDWTLRGDIVKPIDLIRHEIPFEADLAIYDIYSGVWIALTIFTVFVVNLLGAQTNFNIIQLPNFSTGVHLDGHDSTASQRTMQ
jgi:hypothetical protein